MPTNSLKQPASRLAHIDLLECIGIFWVVFVHGTLYRYDYLVFDSLPVYLTAFLRAPMSACVPLFFFANGYLLFGRPLDLKKHCKRLVRMVFLCFFWGSVLIFVLQPIYGQRLSWEEFWYNLSNWRKGYANHLWYMGALVCIHVFYPLMKQAYDTNKKVFYYFVAICALMTFGNTFLNEARTLLGRFLLKERTVYNASYFNMFNPFHANAYAIVYFCTGGIVFSLREKIEAVPARKRNFAAIAGLVISSIGLALMCILFSRMKQKLQDVIWTGFDTVFTYVIVLCLYVLCLNLKKEIPLIRLISVNTLGIYLLHVVPNWALAPLAGEIGFLCTVPGSIVFSLFILFVSLGACLVLKKVPVLKRLL